MGVTRSAHTPLPSELLHKILTDVLAESIHVICMSPDLTVTSWDMDIIWILAGTCFMWKEIVRGILIAAFPDAEARHKR